ncbi:AAEL007399-PB [Aedes aegypti]|uniref:AAEL007399-PB n=1 Tax=Aedes aegypti TaxID=7159 RepID=Q172G7_AEDAE|nr:AAEL007399-PB [Aedes aegypti]
MNVTISDTSRSYTVNCPEDTSRRYCRILDEDDSSYDGCSKSFDITWDTARFRCRILYWGDMDEKETVVNVIVEKSMRDVTWSIEENDAHVVLNCHYRSSVSPCRAISAASKRQMMLLDGHLAERYSAYNTKISQGICALEIRKPLLKEDYGVWRIYLPITPTDNSGCVFNLKDKQHDQDDDGDLHLMAPQAKLVEVFHDPLSSTTSTTELSCKAPYSIEYCYLSGPQGGNYVPDRFDRQKTLGICNFKVSNITSGIWACGFNDASGGEDRLNYFDVKVYDKPGKAVTPEIKASKGDGDKRMLCRTILDLQIEICRFISPSGEVHALSENFVPSDDSRFRYHGEGLRAGECGVEIVEVEREDFGRWKCAIKVQGKDYAIEMDLIEEVISNTAILAISITATVLACAIGGFFAYKKLNARRRVQYQVRLGSSTGGLSTASNGA